MKAWYNLSRDRGPESTIYVSSRPSSNLSPRIHLSGPRVAMGLAVAFWSPIPLGKMPAILFFPNDWLSDEGLRACSLPARALWIDMLCLMHKSPRRGFLQHQSGEPYTAAQLARVAGCAVVEVDAGLYELKTAGVYSCTDAGVIYNRRMVRDENKRAACSEAGRRGGGNPTFKGHSKGTPKGHIKGALEDEDVFESEISLSDLRKQAGEKMRADCAREKPPDSGDSRFLLALADWSKAAGIGWNSACWHAVASWEAQALPALNLPPDPPDALERIVAALRRKGTDFRSVKFALACVRSAVEEWTRTGVPPWVTAPSGGGQPTETPKERGARIAAKVEAELAARNGKHK